MPGVAVAAPGKRAPGPEMNGIAFKVWLIRTAVAVLIAAGMIGGLML